MTKKHFILKGMSLLTALAPAAVQAAFTFDEHDALLVFRQTGSPNLEVNIGAVDSFVNAAPGSTLNITTFTPAQLSAAYSSLNSLNWTVLSGVRPGFGDTTTPDKTLFLTRSRSDVDVQSAAILRKSASTQGAIVSQIHGVAGNGAIAGAKPWSAGTPADPISNTSSAVIIPFADPNSYTSLAGESGNLNGSFAQGTVENTTPASFAGFTRSDFYELKPGSGNGTYLGYFDFDSTGALSFTAVPEPGVPALAFGGLLLSAVWYLRLRRQTSTSQK